MNVEIKSSITKSKELIDMMHKVEKKHGELSNISKLVIKEAECINNCVLWF